MKVLGWILLFVFSPSLVLVAGVLLTLLVAPTAPMWLGVYLLNRRHQRNQRRMGIITQSARQFASPTFNPANN